MFELTVFEEDTVISPVDNLPGVWNDPHSVAADDDVDDVDVDPRQRHLPLSHCALRTIICHDAQKCFLQKVTSRCRIFARAIEPRTLVLWVGRDRIWSRFSRCCSIVLGISENWSINENRPKIASFYFFYVDARTSSTYRHVPHLHG